MTKTPEHLAERYASLLDIELLRLGFDSQAERFFKLANMKEAFLAGYQAAKGEDEAEIKELKDTLAGMEDEHEGLKTIIYDNEQTNLPTPAKWISVKERLPEDGQQVLIYTKGKETYMARIYKGGEAWPISNSCGCCGTDEPFTHWMPLPEPPRDAK